MNETLEYNAHLMSSGSKHDKPKSENIARPVFHMTIGVLRLKGLRYFIHLLTVNINTRYRADMYTENVQFFMTHACGP